MLEEINGVFAVYIMHRNVERVLTWRVKLCQVQHQDDKLLPPPTIISN